MPAILTDPIRYQILSDLEADIASDDSYYYIAIGRADDWNATDTPPVPINSPHEIISAQSSFQSMIQVAANSRVASRVNWSANTIYPGYDSTSDRSDYVVVTDANQVYMCIRPSRDANGTATLSTIQPSGEQSAPFMTTDGYVWKYSFTIGTKDSNDFLAGNFLPVKLVTSEENDADEGTDQKQYAVQQAAVPGQINQIRITNAGTNYTSAPAVTITGDGSGAAAVATVRDGVLTKIEITGTDTAEYIGNMGTGYTYAAVTMDGGGSAIASISPRPGFGADPRVDFRATAIMYTAKPIGDMTGDFQIGNDFRQVCLVSNPLGADGTAYSGASGSCLETLVFKSINKPFSLDSVIQGTASKATAIVDAIVDNVVYYHQDDVTGYVDFTDLDTIEEIGTGDGYGIIYTAAEVVSIDDANEGSAARDASQIDKYSGEVLFIDNRNAVTRSVEQTEDIKIIVKV